MYKKEIVLYTAVTCSLVFVRCSDIAKIATTQAGNRVAL